MPFVPPGFYGYPTNYQPTTKPDDPPPIAEARLKAARLQGASHIGKNGNSIYVRRYVWLKADWDGFEFTGWWECDGLPEEAVKL